MHKDSLPKVFFEQLSQALADGGTCGSWGNAWREDVFDPKISALDSVSSVPATQFSPPLLPSVSAYKSAFLRLQLRWNLSQRRGLLFLMVQNHPLHMKNKKQTKQIYSLNVSKVRFTLYWFHILAGT